MCTHTGKRSAHQLKVNSATAAGLNGPCSRQQISDVSQIMAATLSDVFIHPDIDCQRKQNDPDGFPQKSLKKQGDINPLTTYSSSEKVVPIIQHLISG